MKQYLDIAKRVLDQGISKDDRTGIGSRSLAGCFFEHDMSDGFPLVTTKRVPFRLISTELEFFIKGITDKQWLIDRNCHIWDDWCSPDIIPYSHNQFVQQKMKEERELGPIYGWQWRNFGGEYTDHQSEPSRPGIDQLQNLVDTIRDNPGDRRMIVSAWNPVDLHRMALPPCHWSFQVVITGDKLNLMWNQRSCDVFLGVPFNIASYALLLHLLSIETGYQEGRLCGFFGDTHIYNTHTEQVGIQLQRDPLPLCNIKTSNWTGIFNWCAGDTTTINYVHHSPIKAPIAV